MSDLQSHANPPRHASRVAPMKVHNELSPESVQTSRRLVRTTWAGVALIIAVAALLYFGAGVAKRKHFATAIEVLDSGRVDAAEALVNRFSRDHPDSAESFYLSARLAYARKKPDDVLALLAKARERGYAELPMERLLGLVSAGAGRATEAERLLQAAWDNSNRSDPEVGDALCGLYFQSYRFDPALKVANEWINRDPRDVRALLWRAEIHSRNDPGPRTQIKDFDAILARDPDQAASRLARAAALRQIGRMEDAKRDYDLYLKVKPDDPEGLVGAAKAAEALDEEDQARDYYDRVLAVDPRNVVGLIGRAGIRIRRKEYAEAIILLDAAIKREPNDPEPHYRKGEALARLGRADEAKAEFAIKARLQAEQEQLEKIRKGLVRNPTDVTLMASAAEWLLGHGYEEEGLVWAEKALAREPGRESVIRNLAEYFAKKNQVGRANYYRFMLPPEKR